MTGQTIRGANFTAVLPEGFTIVPPNPMMEYSAMMARMRGIPQPLSMFLLLPPGSQLSQFTPAIVTVEEIDPMISQVVLMGMQNLESPDVAWGLAQSLQVQSVYNFAPMRQITLQNGTALVREFDAAGPPPFNVAIHLLILLIQGPVSTVKVMVMVQTQRWSEFLAPCLQFVGGINVSGGTSVPASVVALADPNHPDQLQLNIINPKTNQQTPVMSVPAGATYNVTIHMDDRSTTVNGNIQGAGIVVGEHSLVSTAVRVESGATIMRDNSGTFVGGNVSGAGNAIGAGATSNISITNAADQQQLLKLIEDLRAEIQKSSMPDAMKSAIVDGVVQPMQQDVKAPEAKSKLESGLEKLNLLVKASGAAQSELTTIGTIAGMIAKFGGIAFHTAAPFLAGLGL